MRSILLALIMLLPGSQAEARPRGPVVVRVKAHRQRTRRGVRVVAAHHRMRPNARRNDNYGTRGNTNPFTRKRGTGTRSPRG